MQFQLPLVILPGPVNLIILGQATLREVLGVDVMHAWEYSVLKKREVVDGNMPLSTRITARFRSTQN